MAAIPIRTLPDQVLRKKASKVPKIDRSVHKLIDDMIETMNQASGVGLAAPQVGISLKVAVIRLPKEEAEEIVLINPEIVRKSGERTVNEGCLSIPGYAGEITRAESVTVKALDRNGKQIRIKGTDLLAQALEHEIDHLNGTLYIDHLESQDKLYKIEPEEIQL